jgi:hypothetical protein
MLNDKNIRQLAEYFIEEIPTLKYLDTEIQDELIDAMGSMYRKGYMDRITGEIKCLN